MIDNFVLPTKYVVVEVLKHGLPIFSLTTLFDSRVF